jgi:hypothetical protein
VARCWGARSSNNAAVRIALVLSPTVVFVEGVWWPGYHPMVTTIDVALAVTILALDLVIVLCAVEAWDWGTRGTSERSEPLGQFLCPGAPPR